MHVRSSAAVSLLVLLIVLLGGGRAEAQAVRVEAGGGWAIPSTEVDVSVEGRDRPAEINPGSGPSGYVAVGLMRRLTDNLSLGVRVRAQQSQLRVGSDDISPGTCAGACPEGRLRALSLEGQLHLTSVGRIAPYFLVGLGVARTTVDAARIEGGNVPQLSETDVTDAGGNVGFGAALRLVRGLSLTAETRVTGSLPGAKDNAVTTFPFTLGLAYHFGGM
ncbi:opacity protein-like surface antigen [Salinibacter ruber]|uniref:outer membrane beta-barrel protein n=1 Tax=Salinibacter ruber TaxID=146919 RepID=UPI000E573B39|nr:outer membrane beta-barrel protein [Salinibacter ruber]MCS3705169.1 opacity protein-like surface antigen [Salinibacter ruber]MCS3854263.1 opacity protein-like surface antigen [Salinibacter ruber]MCS4032972.1 opacity protein-like surface antigen [Salinibacter ruber]